METVKLRKPITVDGEEKKELQLDFDNNLGSDANIIAMQYLQKRNYMVMNPGNDVELYNIMGCMSAGLEPVEADKLHVKDKFSVAHKTMNFFGLDSEE